MASWAIIVAVVLAGPLAAAEPQTFIGKAVNVHDGDTITVLDAANAQHKVRLEGIDAPEIGQPFGTVARDRLAALVKGKSVTVHAHGHDRYGRTLATVDAGGHDVAAQLVAEGLSWHYVRYSHDKTLAAAEADSRQHRRGLWADARPVPPWEWRAGERERKGVPTGR